MLTAWIRFSARLAKSAKADRDHAPQHGEPLRAARTLRASSAAASGRKWRQKSTVVVVPSALSSAAFDDSAAANNTAISRPDHPCGSCVRMNVMKT